MLILLQLDIITSSSSAVGNAANLFESIHFYFYSCLPKQGLFLINNKISKIHPKAFRNMDHLRLLYISYNLLTEIPANLPPNVIELRFHENKINRIQKDAFKGLMKLHVLGKTWFQHPVHDWE